MKTMGRSFIGLLALFLAMCMPGTYDLMAQTFSDNSRIPSKYRDGEIRRQSFTAAIKALECEGVFEVEIVQGNENSITLAGEKKKVDEVRVEEKEPGKVRVFFTEEYDDNKFYRRGLKKVFVLVTLTRPQELGEVELEGVCTLVHRPKYKVERFKLDLEGVSNATMSLDVKDLKINIEGVSKLDLAGRGENMNLELSGTSSLNALTFDVARADLEVDGMSHAWVKVSEKLKCDVSGVSKVVYKGNPRSVEKNVSTLSSVKSRR